MKGYLPDDHVDLFWEKGARIRHTSTSGAFTTDLLVIDEHRAVYLTESLQNQPGDIMDRGQGCAETGWSLVPVERRE